LAKYYPRIKAVAKEMTTEDIDAAEKLASEW
jgi:hypothetical protein